MTAVQEHRGTAYATPASASPSSRTCCSPRPVSSPRTPRGQRRDQGPAAFGWPVTRRSTASWRWTSRSAASAWCCRRSWPAPHEPAPHPAPGGLLRPAATPTRCRSSRPRSCACSPAGWGGSAFRRGVRPLSPGAPAFGTFAVSSLDTGRWTATPLGGTTVTSVWVGSWTGPWSGGTGRRRAGDAVEPDVRPPRDRRRGGSRRAGRAEGGWKFRAADAD